MEIFKYCPYEKKSLSNLTNCELWFASSFRDDEMDNNLNIKELDIDNFYKESLIFFKDNPIIYEKYLSEFKKYKLDFSSEVNIKNIMLKLKEKYHGLTCFSISKYNNFLWNKYSKNHTGFCLRFETNNDNIFFKDIEKVTYLDDLPVLDFNQNLVQSMKSYSTIKRKKPYFIEEEVRVFNHKTGLIRYNDNALLEIILGKNFKGNKKNIKKLIEENYSNKVLISEYA